MFSRMFRNAVYVLLNMIYAALIAALIGMNVTLFVCIFIPSAPFLVFPCAAAIFAGIGAVTGAVGAIRELRRQNIPAVIIPAPVEYGNPVDFGFDPIVHLGQQELNPPVVELDGNVEAEDALNDRLLIIENNSLLENISEREKISLLNDQEIKSYQEFIEGLDGDTKLDAEKKLKDYQAYAAEVCILDEKSKHDADFNPITIHGDYCVEGQPNGRNWAVTYHFEDFQDYIRSCNNQNIAASAPHSRDLLNDPERITIYKGFLSTIVSFILNVRETLQQLQIAKAPELKKQFVRNSRLDYYARAGLFPVKANDANMAAAPKVDMQQANIRM